MSIKSKTGLTEFPGKKRRIAAQGVNPKVHAWGGRLGSACPEGITEWKREGSYSDTKTWHKKKEGQGGRGEDHQGKIGSGEGATGSENL